MSVSVSARGQDASQRAAACRASRRRAAAAAAEERGERERFRARVESGFFPSESLLLLRLSRSIFPMFSSPFCFSLVPNETHRRHHGAGISDLCRPEFRGVTRARERESEHEGGSDEIEKKTSWERLERHRGAERSSEKRRATSPRRQPGTCRGYLRFLSSGTARTFPRVTMPQWRGSHLSQKGSSGDGKEQNKKAPPSVGRP